MRRNVAIALFSLLTLAGCSGRVKVGGQDITESERRALESGADDTDGSATETGESAGETQTASDETGETETAAELAFVDTQTLISARLLVI